MVGRPRGQEKMARTTRRLRVSPAAVSCGTGVFQAVPNRTSTSGVPTTAAAPPADGPASVPTPASPTFLAMSWIERYAADRDLRDFVVLPKERDRVLVRRGYEGRLEELAWWGGERREVGRSVGGREPHPIVELSGGEKVLIRRFRRGGAMRRFTRETYFVGHRALEELRVTVGAARRGVSVPYVVAALERPQPGLGYEAEIALRWIGDGVELVRWLRVDDPTLREAVLRETGKQIGRMHEAGVAHPDLNLRNVLIASPTQHPDQPRVFILDFDRASLSRRPVSQIRRWRDLMRFRRSASKLRAPLRQADWAAIRTGYGLNWPLS